MNEEELNLILKKQHLTISQLNDYINNFIEIIVEKGLVSKQEIDQRFQHIFRGTYEIGGDIILTKYNVEENENITVK